MRLREPKRGIHCRQQARLWAERRCELAIRPRRQWAGIKEVATDEVEGGEARLDSRGHHIKRNARFVEAAHYRQSGDVSPLVSPGLDLPERARRDERLHHRDLDADLGSQLDRAQRRVATRIGPRRLRHAVAGYALVSG
jgi:hypothetical protein